MIKAARTNHPINPLIAKRWSPYGFANRRVAPEDLCSVFEAARWAASSYNEQPWRYLVALRENRGEFQKALSCLTEPNKKWAQRAPIIAFGIVNHRFIRNDRPNRVALHDLGLASATLTLEAASRGILVHQMAGIFQERAQDIYQVPEHHEVVTGLAIGYPADEAKLDPPWAQRDTKVRSRRPIEEFVFQESWGESCDWMI